MALKLYFTNDAPSFTPSPTSSWHRTTGAVYRKLSVSPDRGSGPNAVTRQTETVSTNNYRILHGLWVSEPFERAALIPTTDTFRTIIGRDASHTASFGSWIRVCVLAGSTNTVRGVWWDKGSTNDWGTAAGSAGWSANVPNGEIQAQKGDRFVIEHGVQTLSTSTLSRWAETWYGNGGGIDFDFVAGDTAVTTKLAWGEVEGVSETLWTPEPNQDKGRMFPFLPVA